MYECLENREDTLISYENALEKVGYSENINPIVVDEKELENIYRKLSLLYAKKYLYHNRFEVSLNYNSQKRLLEINKSNYYNKLLLRYDITLKEKLNIYHQLSLNYATLNIWNDAIEYSYKLVRGLIINNNKSDTLNLNNGIKNLIYSLSSIKEIRLCLILN